MILKVVSGSKHGKCYQTLMYPVNAYSFIPAVTLHLWASRPTPKVALQTSSQHDLTKHQRHLGQSETHPSSKLIFETSRGISLALRGHKSNSCLSHLQSPIHKRAPGDNIRTPTSLCNYILVVST